MTGDHDTKPLTMLAAMKAAEFWLLLVAAMAAGIGVSAAITIPATMAGLLISSLPKYDPLYPRAKAAGAKAEFWITITLSIAIAAVTSTAAHVLGGALGWLWSL